MTEMTLKEAIEVLKKFKEWANTPINGSSKYDLIKLFGSIDTVVAKVEKPLPTDEEIREMSNEYARKHTEPEAGYVLNRRFGFQNGAKCMRDLILERRAK